VLPGWTLSARGRDQRNHRHKGEIVAASQKRKQPRPKTGAAWIYQEQLGYHDSIVTDQLANRITPIGREHVDSTDWTSLSDDPLIGGPYGQSKEIP